MKNLFFLISITAILLVSFYNNTNTQSYAGSSSQIWQDTPGPSKKSSNDSFDLAQFSKAFSDLAEGLAPSVVNIYTITKAKSFSTNPFSQQDELFEFFFGSPFGGNNFPQQRRENFALGSGFIINAEKGYIITNSHVVRPTGTNADEIMVKFIGQEKGKGFPAEILGVDAATDVALLKLKKVNKSIVAAALGNSDNIHVGEWVLAIGNPYGHTHSVTQGIISALGRDLGDVSRADFIQTSANINPGNSGGPLFNVKGEVIGINTAIDPRAQGIGFAIPINVAKGVIKQIVDHGEVKRGYIGVGIADITPEIANHLKLSSEDGVLIQSVEPGGPADKEGIQPYDIVLSINGQIIHSSKELSNKIGDVNPGDKANLQVLRDGKNLNFNIKVATRSNKADVSQYIPTQRYEKRFATMNEAGLALKELTENESQQLDLPKGTRGLIIEGIDPRSLASAYGVKAGDVIAEINRKTITSVKSANETINKTIKSGDTLMLRILRAGGFSMILVLDFKDK